MCSLEFAIAFESHGSMKILSQASDSSGGCSQVGIVKKGLPYIMFGDGRSAACKPISEADLARFMAECVSDKSKIDQVLPIGGEPSFLLSLTGTVAMLQSAKLPSLCLLPCGHPTVLFSSALQHKGCRGRNGNLILASLHGSGKLAVAAMTDAC